MKDFVTHKVHDATTSHGKHYVCVQVNILDHLLTSLASCQRRTRLHLVLKRPKSAVKIKTRSINSAAFTNARNDSRKT